MKFSNPLIVVTNMEKAKQFYYDVLGLEVVVDFGANVTLKGGITLQTKDTWSTFIDKDENEILFGGNAAELYFEEDDFDSFIDKLQNYDIEYIHPVKEHSWGQRVVRLYDSDKHIIEVGENKKMVCRRFWNSGMTPEKAAVRMDVPVEFVEACMR